MIETWRTAATSVALPTGTGRDPDKERIDLIRALENLKATAAALQAELTTDLDTSQRHQQRDAGVPESRVGRGVASQVALARRTSPHHGGILLNLARALRHDLPHTAAALRAGVLPEHRAQIIADHTTTLDPDDRREVDETLCGDVSVLEGLGNRRLRHLTRRETIRRDPTAATRRATKAVEERRVTLTPLDDAMAQLTATLPLDQATAAHTALVAAAETARAAGAAGDERTKNQHMADTLVERLTGQAHATDVPITLNVTISDTALYGTHPEAADVTGHGPVPAEIARNLIARAIDAHTLAWIRRFYTDPDGDLVAMTSKQRYVPHTLAHYLRVRDHHICRTPWCDAPARDHDHITPWTDDGPTTATNTQGLCEHCDHTKQTPGWHQRTRPGPGRHTVDTLTPTGHTYTSTAPPPPEPSRTRPTALTLALDQLFPPSLPG